MYYVVFNSITLASRVKAHFQYRRDPVSVTQTPSNISVNGCSYSLRVKQQTVGDIVRVAEELGIRVKGVFEQVGENEFVEVTL